MNLKKTLSIFLFTIILITPGINSFANQNKDINARNSLGRTSLMSAAYAGNKEKVKSLIEAGADLHILDNQKLTALILAAHKSHDEIVELLLEAGAKVRLWEKGLRSTFFYADKSNAKLMNLLANAGADVNEKGSDLRTHLMKACLDGKVDIVKGLLSVKTIDIEASDRNGQNALIYAAYNGHSKVIKLLINAGANIHKVDKAGNNAIYLAIRGGHLDSIKVLHKAGTKVFNKSSTTKDPLALALEMEQFHVAKWILDTHMDLSQKTIQDGLLNAAKRNNIELIEELLKRGGDPRKTDKMAKDALYYTNSKSKQKAHKILALWHLKKSATKSALQIISDNWEKEKWLSILDLETIPENLDTKYGISLYSRPDNSIVALSKKDKPNRNLSLLTADHMLLKAMYTYNTENIKKAINMGANVNIRDKRGNTPLLNILEPAYLMLNATNIIPAQQLADFLIKNGADINARNNKGISPIIQAIKYPLTITSYTGKTSASYQYGAIKRYDTRYHTTDKVIDPVWIIIDLLVKKGADLDIKYKGKVTARKLIAQRVAMYNKTKDSPVSEIASDSITKRYHYQLAIYDK